MLPLQLDLRLLADSTARAELQSTKLEAQLQQALGNAKALQEAVRVLAALSPAGLPCRGACARSFPCHAGDARLGTQQH